MFGLLASIFIFNIIAFKTNKTLTTKQIAHLWMFTIAYQMTFDLYVDIKYHGYWYFTKDIDWEAFLAHKVLVPPVNLMFLNWYPFKRMLWEQVRYLVFWEICLLAYELLTLLPQPIGYFHYGWWNIWYSALINPILLITLLTYYKKFIK